MGVGGWIEYYKIGKALFSELETVIGAAAYVLGKMHHSTMEIIEVPEEVLFDREWERVRCTEARLRSHSLLSVALSVAVAHVSSLPVSLLFLWARCG